MISKYPPSPLWKTASLRDSACLAACLLSLVVLCLPSHAQDVPPCQPMGEIYTSGQDLCNSLWGDSFLYSQNEAMAYTMWFFEESNPNDDTSQRLVDSGHLNASLPVDTCHLDYYHKDGSHAIDNEDHPQEEPDSFQECHPWKDRSCCFQDTVSSVEKLKNSYGDHYRWDRCGPLSSACERFFVQEACFYECDPHVGLFRRFKADGEAPGPAQTEQPVYDPKCDESSPEFDPDSECSHEHNTWEVYQMPISASYCDAWWLACKDDLFCASDGGNFFSCAREYKEADSDEDEIRVDQGLLIGVSSSIAVVIVVLAALILLFFARERAGKPLFVPLEDQGDELTQLE